MPFINSVSFDCEKNHPFPYNIPAIQYAKNISIDNKATIFIGDNGCGKSTLLETIAMKINLPLISGYISGREGFGAANELLPFLHIDWKRNTSKGFFFRAEDFSDFLKSAENERMKIDKDLADLKGNVDENIIREMSNSMNYKLHRMKQDYGDDMQAYSHGEACMKILETRIQGKGIYLLDEPESALSPLKQLSLLYFIIEALKTGNSQFIISTHSPIMMGLPGALLYEIRNDCIESVAYKETDHYSITKGFLDSPERYLSHF